MTRTQPIAAGLALVCCTVVSSAQRSGGQGAITKAATNPNRVTGRITGANGLPVQSVIVSLLQKHELRTGVLIGLVNAQLRVVPNDRGEYSITIGPGKYFVVAIPVNEPMQQNGRPATSGHAVTYFPAATDIAQAQEVTVTMAAPVVANVSLRATKLFNVSGTARWSDGQPAGSGTVGISSDNHLFGLDGRRAPLARDGTFRIPVVGPGQYCIQHTEGGGGRGGRRLVSAARITVVDRDLTAVRVVPVVPVVVKGRVIPAAVDRQRLSSLEITIGASPAAGGCYFGAGRPGTLQPNGTFEFNAEPMDGYIRVWVNREEIKPVAVRHAGAEIRTGRFTFSGSTPLTGIEVELPRLPPAIGK